MKRLSTLLLFVLFVSTTSVAVAQHQHDEQLARTDSIDQKSKMTMMQSDSMRDMMDGGSMGDMHQIHSKMMSQLMNDPFNRASLMVRILPTMGAPLELSEDQITSFENSLKTYKKRLNRIKEELESVKVSLQDVLSSQEPDLEVTKTQMRQIAVDQVDLKLLGIETAHQMKGKLTSDQLELLSKMSPMKIHHHMMTNMSMMEMMQMMGRSMMRCRMDGMMSSDGVKDGMMRMEMPGMNDR